MNNRQGGIWESVEAGFHMLGVLVIGILFWPLFLYAYIGSWPTIFVEGIWLICCGFIVRAFRNRRRNG